MEKSVLKNILLWATLVPLLWLAGCAAPTTVEPGGLQDSANTVAINKPKTSGLQSPVYPAGGLRPLLDTDIRSASVHALSTPADIWDRIRRGFAMQNLDSDLVRDREQWYSARPEYMQRMTERGNKYLFYIVEELERRNMPTELALLPFIESAYNPQAVSSAKAAGIWQFMPATGKHFDLKQNMFRDDRRDVLASTRAALDYLQKLYGLFGDWHLALAAYNWGEGSVGRAIAKNQKAGLGRSYTDLKMPVETQFYVPKLQAVKNIIASPESFRVTLPLIENHPYFQTVDIQNDIDVSVAAKLAEVSMADFRALNPSATKPVLLAAGTPQILLPWDNALIFQANFGAYTGGRLANWTAWVAPTTLRPADAAKQLGMLETELRDINNIPARMLIRAGSTLVVRRNATINADVSNHVADNGHLSLAPEVVLKRTLVKAGKKDTVASLAQRYRVTAAAISDWNQVSASAALKPGQSVVLYLPMKINVPRIAHASKAAPAKRVAKTSHQKSPVKKPTRLARQ